MSRFVTERWHDTAAFGIALGLSGALVVPVLLLGVLVTAIGGAAMLFGRSAMVLEPVHNAVSLLSAGGVLGFLGYLRARRGAEDPSRHNVTATLLFLTAGVLTALSVAGVAVVMAVLVLREASDAPPWSLLGGAFAAANLVWAVEGIARMQGLLRRYAEHTGRAFDSVPVIFLFVALVLMTVAVLATTTLGG